MSASPNCYIGTSNPPASTSPFYTANTNTTIYVKLQSIASVTTWSLTLVDASISATISIIDTLNQVAQITLPNTYVGSSILLQSTVNNGIGVSGNIDPNLTTRLLIVQSDALTSDTTHKIRQIPYGEEFEDNASKSYASAFNNFINHCIFEKTIGSNITINDGYTTFNPTGGTCKLYPSTNNANLHGCAYTFNNNGFEFRAHNLGKLFVINTHASNGLVLKHNSGSATGAKFSNNTGADITLAAGETAMLIFDYTVSPPIYLTRKI
jgi:hypothetical protein